MIVEGDRVVEGKEAVGCEVIVGDEVPVEGEGGKVGTRKVNGNHRGVVTVRLRWWVGGTLVRRGLQEVGVSQRCWLVRLAHERGSRIVVS